MPGMMRTLMGEVYALQRDYLDRQDYVVSYTCDTYMFHGELHLTAGWDGHTPDVAAQRMEACLR